LVSYLTATVTYYGISASNTLTYTIYLNLSAPPMENGYFQQVHLVGTRMFGPNNDILYMFETINPNYLAPVLVNWQSTNAQTNFTNLLNNNSRPNVLLAPFEPLINE
jgi:hypothetical protein